MPIELIATELKHNECIVLTANQRLQRFTLNTLFPNGQVFRCPNVMSVDSWVQETWLEWQDLGHPLTCRQLISTNEEWYIWQKLVQSYLQDDTLLLPNSMPDSLAEARKILQLWQIELSELENYPNEETHFLTDMLKRFVETLDEHQWVTHEDALKTIASIYSLSQDADDTSISTPNFNAHLIRYKKIYLFGFNDINPLLKHVLSLLTTDIVELDQNFNETVEQETPLSVKVETPSEIKSPIICAQNTDEELSILTHWCEEKLNSDAITQQKTKNLGIIIPNLSSIKHKVEDAFLKRFAPNDFAASDQFHTEVPFDISLGEALNKVNLVHDALLLLQLSNKTIERDQLVNILSSQYWGNALDHGRIIVAEWLNATSSHYVNCSRFIAKYSAIEQQRNDQQENSTALPSAADKLNAFLSELKLKQAKNSGLQSYSNWSQTIKKLLQLLGWPGPKALNTLEFQASDLFYKTLDNLGTYDTFAEDTERVSLGEALDLLSKVISGQLFHPQIPHRPIKIMGLMEGAGLRFDACWIMGMSDKQIPAEAKPNALIPLELQQKYATPRCSPERELTYAREIINAYKQCSQEVIFSFAAHCDDEKQNVSPLLEEAYQKQQRLQSDINMQDNYSGFNSNIVSSNVIDQHYQNARKHIHFDSIDTTTVPIIPEGNYISGGASHIKLHNISPLHAFFLYRLGAVASQPTVLGFSLSEKGNLIHSILAQIWQELKNSDQLANTSEDQLTQRINEIVTECVQQRANKADQYLSLSNIDLEVERMTDLIHTWINTIEKARPHFKVMGIEDDFEVNIQNRHIAVRVDRIDLITHPQQDQKDELIIIDYKSGDTRLAGLEKAPLLEPQLALYTLALEQNERSDSDTIKAVAFAQINRSDITLKGIGELESELKGISTASSLNRNDLPNDWRDVLNWWKEDINNSVTEIVSGQSPHRIQYPQALSYYDYLTPIVRNFDDAENE